MSRNKKRSKADEFEFDMDGVGLDGEYNDAPPAAPEPGMFSSAPEKTSFVFSAKRRSPASICLTICASAPFCGPKT